MCVVSGQALEVYPLLQTVRAPTGSGMTSTFQTILTESAPLAEQTGGKNGQNQVTN